MMKKLCCFIFGLGLGFSAFGQGNTTQVYGTNAVRTYPSTTHAGKVMVGLDTSLTGFAANTGIQWNGSAFVWASSSGGIPTNWTWTANLLTNTVASSSFDLATTGGQTNSAASFFGRWPGAITFGDTSAVQMFREATGLGWSIRTSANANIGWKIGSSLGIRGAASTGGTINSSDTSIVYIEDASGGDINHILPPVNQNDTKVFFFLKGGTDTNVVTISAPSGTLIDDTTNAVLKLPGDGIVVWNNGGTLWNKIITKNSYNSYLAVSASAFLVDTGNAIGYSNNSLQYTAGGWFQNTPASNDTKHVYMNLEAGRYTFYKMGVSDNNRGMERIQFIDDRGLVAAQVDGLDWYSVATTLNVRKTATILLTNSGNFKVSSTITNKNGSSSSFFDYCSELGVQKQN